MIRGKVLGGKLGPARAREAVDTLPSLVIDDVGVAMLLVGGPMLVPRRADVTVQPSSSHSPIW